jgi:hypothetical protein
MSPSARFPIKFERWYAVLSSSLLLFPSSSYVAITGNDVSVRMGWAFRATFARSQIAGVTLVERPIPLTRGVHGWAGRWLVNGAGDGVVALDLVPGQRGYVLGAPVSLRQLLVSVEEPAGLIAALRDSQSPGSHPSS